MTNENLQTPIPLLRKIEKEMGIFFTLDPCTTEDNPLGTKHFYTKEQDGLVQIWWGDVVMNPPYSRGVIDLWVKKAREEQSKNPLGVTVGILPLRTANWFMENINSIGVLLPDLSKWRKLNRGECGIHFLGKRVKFIDPETGEQEKNSPSWDTFLAIWV